MGFSRPEYTRGLSRGAAGNPRVPRLLPGTLGNLPGPPGLRSNPSPPLGFQELGLLPRLPSDPISAPKGSPRSSQAFASPRTPQLHPLAHAPFSRQPAQISPGPLGLRASPRRLCLLSWVTRVRVCVYPSVGQCPPKPGQSGVLPCCLGVLGGSFEPV